MDKEVRVEFYCRDCGHEMTSEYPEYECPVCGSTDVFKTRYLICDCGEKVYLGGFTNECCECGKLYNGFGQELAPIEEWDPEDCYACLGPQNYTDDD